MKNMKIISDRQWKAFKSHKTGYYSVFIFLGMIFLSCIADFVANSRPLIMRWENKTYFPIVSTVTPTDLGISSTFLEVNFKALEQENPDKGFFLWPLIKFDPLESDRSLSAFPSAPDSAHWFGTDDRGRDLAARLIYGLRTSLVFAFAVWFLSYLIGVTLGGIQGFFGGRIDFTLQRIIEILSSLPRLFLLIILVTIFKSSLLFLVLFSSLLGWISISYYVRAEFLKLRKQDFVESARASGSSRARLIFRHILPNALTPIITFTPFMLTAEITGLAALDYLGLGLPPPSPSWGEAMAQALRHFDHAWWLAVFPGFALISTLIILNFIGEALRQALDPRSGQ